MYAVTECCLESRNGPEVKIDILDEGFWSPEVFWRYRVMTSMTERCFESPDKCWGLHGPREGGGGRALGFPRGGAAATGETLDGFGRPPLGNLPPKPGGVAALGQAPPPLQVT